MEIREQGFEQIERYVRIPISFRCESRLNLEALRNGVFREDPIEPGVKDYDALPHGSPVHYPACFDTTHWNVLIAHDQETPIGGAILAWNTSDFNMLEGRTDLAVLVDFRVAPQVRGQGVGRRLFEKAKNWARSKGCIELKIETQDINVVACRFYAAMGCTLSEIHENAYGPELDEAMLIWRTPI